MMIAHTHLASVQSKLERQSDELAGLFRTTAPESEVAINKLAAGWYRATWRVEESRV